MTMYRKSEEADKLQPVQPAPFGARYKEEDLEDILEVNPHVLAEDETLLIINRQPSAGESGTPDLLALDEEGNIVIVELKRGRTPRDVVAQALEYAAWAANLDADEIKARAEEYLAKRGQPETLETAWQDAFELDSAEGEEVSFVLPQLNGQQRILLVLEGRDERVRNVVSYLRKFGIDINIIEYLYYNTDSGEDFFDIEAVHTPQESAGVQPSEAALLKQWSPEVRDTYRALKETLLAGDDQIQIVPKKAAVSFYKQTRAKPVFIGGFEVYKSSLGYWLRRDSLDGHLDVDAAIEGIKNSVPQHITFHHQGENNFSFSFAVRPEDGRTVGQLVLDHIARALE